MPLAVKTEAECKNNFDYWIYILNNMENLEKIPFTDKNPVLVDLENAATRLGMTFDEEVAYQRALKRMWDYDAVMEGEREYARAKGLEEGLEQGLAEGREKGLAEGREEERLSMAMSLKSLGVNVETIAKASGLSIEKIESL